MFVSLTKEAQGKRPFGRLNSRWNGNIKCRSIV